MLVKHPITVFVYKFGYNGVDDLYNYWYKNKEEILEFIIKKNKHGKINDSLIQTFEFKLRWSTWLGIWFRFYTGLESRKSTGVFDFKQVAIKYGFDTVYLDNFYEEVSGNISKIDGVDLRGISLVDFKFKDVVFEDVDFSHSTLDFSEFYNVEFKNCNLSSTSFYRAKIVNCDFDELCTLTHNDFSNAYVSGKFNCPIHHSIINHASMFDLLKMKYGHSTVLYHSKINSKSFIAACHDTSLRDRLNKCLRYYSSNLNDL